MHTPTACKIFVYDVETIGTLHPMYTPCEWEHQQHAIEPWLSRALSAEWRVASASDADLIFLANTGFSRWCTAVRELWMRYDADGTRGKPGIKRIGYREQVCDSEPAKQQQNLLARVGDWGAWLAAQLVPGASPPRRPAGARISRDANFSDSERVVLREKQLLRDERSKRMLWNMMVQASAEAQRQVPDGRRMPPTRVVTLTSAECPRPYQWPARGGRAASGGAGRTAWRSCRPGHQTSSRSPTGWRGRTTGSRRTSSRGRRGWWARGRRPRRRRGGCASCYS